MKLKARAIIAGVCILTFLGVCGAAALAAGAAEDGAPAGEQPAITDGETAETTRGKRFDINEKWNALTDEQKAEIYGLMDQMGDIQSAIIDKYAEFGIIDEETASLMKEKLAEAQSKTRESGDMPGIMGRGYCRGGKMKAPSGDFDPDSEDRPGVFREYRHGDDAAFGPDGDAGSGEGASTTIFIPGRGGGAA